MRRILIGIVAVLAIVAVAAVAWASRHPAIAPIERPAVASLDKALVDKGATLVAIGDCVVCHTNPGGEPFAGGRKLDTPFGTVFSTNITPDTETGIGRWSEAAFVRALREGVDREGRYLYPAFPYDHFAKVSDEDAKAIYANLMSRKAMSAPAPQNTLVFPLNFRILVAGWQLLFLPRAGFTPDPSKDARWNRGAYLVEGLGHCGACHTGRNLLGAEKASAHFGGGEAEGWHAPALNAVSPAPVPWTDDALVNYLLDGWDEDHGVAGGPMTDVANGLADLSEDDAYAMAAYLMSFQDSAGAKERGDAALALAQERAIGGMPLPAPADTAEGRGQTIFTRVCANCHRSDSQATPLSLLSSVNGPDPRNLIQTIDRGIKPPDASPDLTMPPFAGSLTEEQVADLATFVRSRFTRQPPWPDLKARVAEVRKMTKAEK